MNNLKDFIAKLFYNSDNTERWQDSYSNFHAKDVDYYCLFRSAALTVKLYDIQGRNGYVVNPHSHRYDFKTYVLKGMLEQIEFFGAPRQGYQDRDEYNEFQYKTVLDGTPSWTRTARLNMYSKNSFLQPGDAYYFPIDGVHTIKTPRRTVLLILQFEDKENMTYYYSKDFEPPNLDSLYNPMTPSYWYCGIGKILDEI